MTSTADPYGDDWEPPDEPLDGWNHGEAAEIQRVRLAIVPAGAEAKDALAEFGQLYPALDWRQVWEETPDDIDWLVEPIIERGRLYSLYSPAKAGKSLLTLEIAAALATGRAVLGTPARQVVHVLYVDMENSPADLVERLSAYGYGPEDLDNLHYLSFPSLPALDSPNGGQALLGAALHYQAAVVVIDTVSRVIQGKENDSDTFHALYRCALAPLKGRGITVIRLDHAGKDDEKGQRGSSAKSSDVDVVWKLAKVGSVMFTLQRMAARNTHSPEEIQLVRRFSPLRHEVAGSIGIEPAVVAIVDKLDELSVPTDLGRLKVKPVLTAADFPCNNVDLGKAIKFRKDRAAEATS